MKVTLFPFQQKALDALRQKASYSLDAYCKMASPQVVSFTAPTGAGKTIIMSALIESIFYGDSQYPPQPDSIIIWLSDQPELNEQSRLKIETKSDKIQIGQCVTIKEESFDAEVLEDGRIYFLNTQKLSKTSNLTKHSDSRNYTIWETLSNTINTKFDRLYFIIDEAHRGAQGREASKATTIMQKFIKGSEEDGLRPMPVVIGMSATPERFNKLVLGTGSSTHYVIVTADEVRQSGLLKDKIVIEYPEDQTTNKSMAVLQAAADEWNDKCKHWYQYSYEQHYKHVYPIFVIQVENGKGSKLSETDLDDCLKKIEERTGTKFVDGEVVHTFGQKQTTITINNINVPYEEPSRINDDKKIKVVFFKEALSTGWDCPRAETMMSFRAANDATYIAQLLGRMVRTPLQMHILVDETLNDVHLYLPFFNNKTVTKIVEELQNAEGGDIPTEISGELLGSHKTEVLSIEPTVEITESANSTPNFETPTTSATNVTPQAVSVDTPSIFKTQNQEPPSSPVVSTPSEQNPSLATGISIEGSSTSPTTSFPSSTSSPEVTHISTPTTKPIEDTKVELPKIDRCSIMKAINTADIATFEVRKAIVHNYLRSLFNMVRLLSQAGLYISAEKDVLAKIVGMIHSYIEELKATGKFEELKAKALEFKLNKQIFDIFGESVDNHTIHNLFSTTDTDIERQFQAAERKLYNLGIAAAYSKKFYNAEDENAHQLEFILYAGDESCIEKLYDYCRDTFHNLNDEYRTRFFGLDDKYRNQYDKIVTDGDLVSKHSLRIPERINVDIDTDGKQYLDHLFVNGKGVATFKLTSWEESVLDDERKNPEFVCWMRNPSRKPWALCIPYEMDGETKPFYPDFLVVRKTAAFGYVFDILEPHNSSLKDNICKAKGLAKYAQQCKVLSRIQLIRLYGDKIVRLDLNKTAIRDKVLSAISNEELDHLFLTEGISY